MDVLLFGLSFLPRQQFLPILFYTYDTLALTYHNLGSRIFTLALLMLTPMLLLLFVYKLHYRLFTLLGRAAERLEEVFASDLGWVNILA